MSINSTSQFDVHIGYINQQYESVIRNVSGYDFNGDLKLRSFLINAIISISDKWETWRHLDEIINSDDKIRYDESNFTVIYEDERRVPVHVWLLNEKQFIQDNNKCYTWNIDKVIKTEDPYYDLYFYLLLHKINPYDLFDFLYYQLEQSFDGNIELFDATISRAAENYNHVLKYPSTIPTSVEKWKIHRVKNNSATSKRGRKSKEEGGARQKETAILAKLLKDSLRYNISDKKIANALSTITPYSASGIQNALSALQTGNDADFQFSKQDFEQVERVLSDMQSVLEELKNKTLKNTKH